MVSHPFTKRELTRKVRRNVRDAKTRADRRSKPPYQLVRTTGWIVHRTHTFGDVYCWHCLMCPNMRCCSGALLPCGDNDLEPCIRATSAWLHVPKDEWRRRYR